MFRERERENIYMEGGKKFGRVVLMREVPCDV